ncbi:MAG: hypothetical protein KKB34_15040 [Bacteroidetes bacterium]|nr:hypothetical protein [Bacteroidota bacterium]
MEKDKNLPSKTVDKEIVSLNPELYTDLSITELEERLEMSCYINFGCGCEGQCVGYVCVYEGCIADCIADSGGLTS